MPAGVSVGEYLRFATAVFLTMFAGAQAVHVYYRPLDDMEQLVEAEKQRMIQEAEEIKQAKQVKS